MKREYNLIKRYYKAKKDEKKWSKWTKITVLLYVVLVSSFAGVYWLQYQEQEKLSAEMKSTMAYSNDEANQKRYAEIADLASKKQTLDAAIEEIDRINVINQERPILRELSFRTLLQPNIDIHSIRWSESLFQVEMQSRNNKLPSEFAKLCQDSDEFAKVEYFGFKYNSQTNLYISTFEYELKGGQAND